VERTHRWRPVRPLWYVRPMHHGTTELAAYFGVARQTVMRWIQSGELPAKRRGRGAYVVKRSDAERFAKSHNMLTDPKALRG
jgi:excisionase family DNA binding protein